MATPTDLIAETARGQRGLFTREQARQAGFSTSTIDDLVTSGRWERWAPAVYGPAGLPRSWRRSVLSAVLAAGPGAAAARHTAARIWDLPVPTRGTVPSVVVPYRRRGGYDLDGVELHRSRTLVADHVVTVRDVPTTIVERTIAESCAGRGVEVISETMAHAIRRRLTDAPSLRAYADLAGPIRGIGTFRRGVDRLDPETARSRAKRELTLLRGLVAAGLGRPVVAHEVLDEDGRVIAEIDLAYVAERLAIEVDDYHWHSTPFQKRHDLARQNHLILRGWRVLRFSSEDIDHRLEWVIRQIAAALRAVPAAL